MLKKTTLAILGTCISGFAFAGTMGPACVPGDVTVPCAVKTWDLGVQALYLQPLYSGNMEHGSHLPTLFNGNNNDWGWGYRLEGSYHFSTGNDITLNWLHYDVDSNNGTFLGAYPLVGVGVISSPYSLSMENQFDEVNLVFGQSADLGMRQSTRFYGGLQYANIQANGDVAYAAFPRVLALTKGVFGFQNSDFKGVGPALGMDYNYDLTTGLSLTANLASSILYGTTRYRDTTFYGNALVVESVFGSEKALVPSVEAKLGANYAHAIGQGMLNIEGGYQVLNYFNAFNGLESFAVIPGVRRSDFGLYGPYVGIKWLGNA